MYDDVCISQYKPTIVVTFDVTHASFEQANKFDTYAFSELLSNETEYSLPVFGAMIESDNPVSINTATYITWPVGTIRGLHCLMRKNAKDSITFEWTVQSLTKMHPSSETISKLVEGFMKVYNMELKNNKISVYNVNNKVLVDLLELGDLEYDHHTDEVYKRGFTEHDVTAIVDGFKISMTDLKGMRNHATVILSKAKAVKGLKGKKVDTIPRTLTLLTKNNGLRSSLWVEGYN